MIKLTDVSKVYGTKTVLNNVNLTINQGDFIAIIGMNGSGKTTLTNLIVGSKKPTSGTVTTSLKRRDFGLQIQDVVFSPHVKVKDYIKLQQDLYQIDRETIDQMVNLIGLSDLLAMKIKKLSGGQRQRLNILMAIVHSPEVMIFDELTTGLDALSRYEVREILRKLNQMGKTIILISHYMDEVEDLCNKVICLKDGQISDYLTVDQLLTKYETVNLDEYFKVKMLGANYEF